MNDDRLIEKNAQGEAVHIFLAPCLQDLQVLEHHKHGEHYVVNDNGHFIGVLEQTHEAGNVIQIYTSCYLTASDLRDIANFIEDVPAIKPLDSGGGSAA